MPPPLSPSLWLKADAGVFKDAGVTPCADGDTCQQWNDQSGNSHNASQSTSGQRPVFKAGVIKGNLPALLFDNTDDGMATALTVSAPYTVAVAFWPFSTSGAHRAVQGSNNWLIGPYNGFIAHYAGGWVEQTTGPAVDDSQPVRAVATNTGSASHFLVNNVDVTNSTSPTGTPGTFDLGATGAFAEPLNGYLCEVVVYNSVLGSTDLASLDSYLQARWNPSTTFYVPMKPAKPLIHRGHSLAGGLRFACAFNQWSEGTLAASVNGASQFMTLAQGASVGYKNGGIAFTGSAAATITKGPALSGGPYSIFLYGGDFVFSASGGAYVAVGDSAGTDTLGFIRAQSKNSVIFSNFSDDLIVDRVPDLTGRYASMCGTFDGNKLQTVYVDGVSYGTRTASAFFGGNSAVQIATGGSSLGVLNWTAQCVLIYDRALSASEVALLSSDPYAPLRPSMRSDLIGAVALVGPPYSDNMFGGFTNMTGAFANA